MTDPHSNTASSYPGPLTLSPWRGRAIIILGCICFGYAFFQRVTPSAMVDDLMRSFNANAAMIGNLSALYFYFYAGLQIPIGTLMDKWGARIMLSTSMLLAGLGSLIFSLATIVEIAYLGRILVGIGSGVAFVATLTLAARWFPPHRFAFLSGITMFSGLMSGVFGQGPLAAIVVAFGWRPVMAIASLFALALAVVIWVVVRNSPEEALGLRSEHTIKNQNHSLMQSFLGTVKRMRVWYIGMIAMACSGPMLAFGALWGVPYMTERYGLTRPEAASYASLLLIGFACGAPLAGWISDALRRRKMPLVIASFLNIVLVALFFYGPDVPLVGAGLYIFLLGIVGAGMASTYAFAKESVPPQMHGTVTGLVNMMTVGAGALLQPIVGLILQWQWDGEMRDGVPVYTPEMFNIAFLSVLVLAVFGFVAALATHETFCKQQVTE
ncbi:MAG: MFS transporter [Hyphomicrobiales bacterium]